MTVLIRTAALLRLIAALPGRCLIRWLDERKATNGVPPLGRFLRGCVHAFLWFAVLMATAMALTPAPPTTVVPHARTPVYRPTVVPTVPTTWAPPTSTPAPTSTPPIEDITVPDVPDNDDDGESRFCRGRWWC